MVSFESSKVELVERDDGKVDIFYQAIGLEHRVGHMHSLSLAEFIGARLDMLNAEVIDMFSEEVAENSD